MMKINNINSSLNNTLKTIRLLEKKSFRDKEGLFLIEGLHCLVEACKTNLIIEKVIVSKTYFEQNNEQKLAELDSLKLEEIFLVETKLFSELSDTNNPLGILAIAQKPNLSSIQIENLMPRIWVVSDSIQDPGNLGTLIRTAYAAEFAGLILLKGTVDPYNPKVVRAASGALFNLALVTEMDVEKFTEFIQKKNIRLILCEANAKKSYFETNLVDNIAIVLGNEGRGISKELKNIDHESISIPMNKNSESLNVSVSGGIILFESYKQRLINSKI